MLSVIPYTSEENWKVLFTDMSFLAQEHYYDPVSDCGFLQTKLHNLRQTLEQGQRRYRKQKVTNDCGGGKRWKLNTDELKKLIFFSGSDGTQIRSKMRE